LDNNNEAQDYKLVACIAEKLKEGRVSKIEKVEKSLLNSCLKKPKES